MSGRPPSLLAEICTPSRAYAALTSRKELPISFLWRMTARDAPMTPPSTVSFNRLRRALVRKICSLSSLTFFSRERRRTVYAPESAPPPDDVAPAAVGSAGAGGAPVADGGAGGGLGAGAGAAAAVAPAAAAAGGASAARTWPTNSSVTALSTIQPASPFARFPFRDPPKRPVPRDVMSL